MGSSVDPEQYTIRAIDRAVDVLAVLGRAESALPLGAIALRASLSKPTAFRVLMSLQRRGFVNQTSDGDYALGFEIVRLAAIRKRQTNIWEEALPYMRRVRDAVNETTLLCVRVGDDRYILDQVESTQDIRRVAKIGERVPLYIGAASRVLLAALSDDEIDAYITRTDLKKLAPNTITDDARLRRELVSVREHGYAIGRDERSVGGTGIAVGVRDHTGATVAALQVTVPNERWTDPLRVRCLDVLACEAATLSAQLGDCQPQAAVQVIDRRKRYAPLT